MSGLTWPNRGSKWTPGCVELREARGDVPADLPDIHPNIADVYRRKVARLADRRGNAGTTSRRPRSKRPWSVGNCEVERFAALDARSPER